MWFDDKKDKSSGQDIFNFLGPLFPSLQIVVEIYLTPAMQPLQKRYQKASSTTLCKTTLSKTPPTRVSDLPSNQQPNKQFLRAEVRFSISKHRRKAERHGHTGYTPQGLSDAIHPEYEILAPFPLSYADQNHICLSCNCHHRISSLLYKAPGAGR